MINLENKNRDEWLPNKAIPDYAKDALDLKPMTSTHLYLFSK